MWVHNYLDASSSAFSLLVLATCRNLYRAQVPASSSSLLQVPGTWYLVEASRSDTCPATQAWQQVPRGAAGSCRQARLILTLNFYFYSSTHYYYYYYYYYICIYYILLYFIYIYNIYYYYCISLYYTLINNIFLQYIAIILQLFCCNNILQYWKKCNNKYIFIAILQYIAIEIYCRQAWSEQVNKYFVTCYNFC